MPTTTAGTPYTITTTTSTGYGTCLLAIANAHANDTNVPTVLYGHGASGSYDQFATLPAWQLMRDWVIDNGCAFIEGAGGLTNTAGAQHWGATDARMAYGTAYPAWADTLFDRGPTAILVRSMSGVIGPWLYLQSPIASQCVGLIVNSGVQTLTYGELSSVVGENVPENKSRYDNRPSGQYFSPKIYEAYGASNFAEFATAAHDHDPMNIDPALWNGKKVLQLVGTEDHTVTPQTRGAYPLRALYEGRPAVDLLDVRLGGDHEQANGSYLQVAAMTSFLSDLGFGTAVEIPDPVYYEAEDWLYNSGNLTKLEYRAYP